MQAADAVDLPQASSGVSELSDLPTMPRFVFWAIDVEATPRSARALRIRRSTLHTPRAAAQSSTRASRRRRQHLPLLPIEPMPEQLEGDMVSSGRSLPYEHDGQALTGCLAWMTHGRLLGLRSSAFMAAPASTTTRDRTRRIAIRATWRSPPIYTAPASSDIASEPSSAAACSIAALTFTLAEAFSSSSRH